MKEESLGRAILRATVMMPAAALLLGSCSDHVSEAVPAETFYDGPIGIRAEVAGTLETRVSYPAGDLTSGTWYLNCPYGVSVGRTFKAEFNDLGYAELSDRDGNPVEITWANLSQMDYPVRGYYFTMDNVPHFYRDDSRCFDGWLKDKEGGTIAAYAIYLTDEEIRDYGSAGLESEDGEINKNDIIQGKTTLKDADYGNKVYVDLTLYHLMARVHVELTSSTGTVDFSQPVKVWIDHLASEVYAMNRIRDDIYENTTLIIRPVNKDGHYIEEVDDATLYDHTFYLTGSEEETGTLVPVPAEGGEAEGNQTYRTGRLILPPQSTHRFSGDAALRPKIYVELADGTRYSSYLPDNILPQGSGGEQFGEFRSGWDVTLKGDITDTPPYIKFTAVVEEWNGKGRYTLDTNQAGVYSKDEYETAVELLKEYGKAKDDGKDDSELGELKHRMERYGHWDSVGMFIFDFFHDIKGDIPESSLVDNAYRLLFGVDLHGHEVYGCKLSENKSDAQAGGELKNKMVGETQIGVGDYETLKAALTQLQEYVKYLVEHNSDIQAGNKEVLAKRAEYRADMEKYGWWEITSTYWHLHISITNEITGEESQLPKFNIYPYSAGKSYFEFAMTGHTVLGCTKPEELKNKIIQ